MSRLSRLYRHAAERRGSSLLYAIAFAVLGAAMGVMAAFMLIVGPIAWISGTVLSMPVVGTLIDFACDFYDTPLTKWLPGADACNDIEMIRAAEGEADATGVTAKVRESLDCSNWPEDQQEEGRRKGWCKDGLLDETTEGVIPADKAQWLIGIYIRAGDKYKVPWRVIAAINGARTNFGEKNCSNNGEYGGFLDMTDKEWKRYGVDAGSVQNSGGRCWKFEYTPGVDREDGKAFVDYAPDGKTDTRDPVDAIFTQARLLSENGAKIAPGKPMDWRYNGDPAAGCAVDEDIDGDIFQPPPPLVESDEASNDDPGTTGETPDAVESGTGTPLMGQSRLTAKQLVKWYKSVHSQKPPITVSVDELAEYFVDEGNAQNIRADIAWVQVMIETGWLYYRGSMVKPTDNNFSGFGACDSCKRGYIFDTARDGVRAQMQHLWLYADKNAKKDKTARKFANPRWDSAVSAGRLGVAPVWEKMGGDKGWASDAGYGPKVVGLYKQALKFNGMDTSNLQPPDGPTPGSGGSGGDSVPSSGWLDGVQGAPKVIRKAIEYPKSRKDGMADYSKKRYGAGEATWKLEKPKYVVHHYTAAGTMSSAWNTFNPDREYNGSRPNVCSHFIIDKDGKIYQLVPLTTRCRHAIGLNHRSIGIENVGNSDAEVMGRAKQKKAMLELSRYLIAAYGIEKANVIGHGEVNGVADFTDKTGDKNDHGDMSAATMKVFRSQIGDVKPLSGAAGGGRGVVWVQAGHYAPNAQKDGEPGYRAQTGAAGEAEFNKKVRDAMIEQIKAAGHDARPLGAKPMPLGGEGDVFLSVHYDSPGSGRAMVGAVAGNGENYYKGDGVGTESRKTPWPGGVPHRKATKVTPEVKTASKKLAEFVDKAYKPVYKANGGRSYAGIVTGMPRVNDFYGYYRTNAKARVLVEAGAGDEAIIKKPDVIATALTKGVIEYLKAEGVEGGGAIEDDEDEAGEGKDEVTSVKGTPPPKGISSERSSWPVATEVVFFPLKTTKEVTVVDNFVQTGDELGRGKHPGVDVIAPKGTKVRPPVPGVVTAMGSSTDGGRRVELTMPGGDRFVFGHLASIGPKVTMGARLTPNDIIGTISHLKGKVGVKKPHLHFEMFPPRGAVPDNKYRRFNPMRHLAVWLGYQLPAKEKPKRAEKPEDAPVTTDPSLAAKMKKLAMDYPDGPLLDHIDETIAIARAKGVDPRAVFAIAVAESGMGSHSTAGKFNAWGMLDGDGKLMDLGDSWKDGITKMVDNLTSDTYLGAGLYTLKDIGRTWCGPDDKCPNWFKNVKAAFITMGGKPSAKIFTAEAIKRGAVDGDAPKLYSGAKPNDRISRAIAHREGEDTNRTPCYVATVHGWYEALLNRPQGISGDDPSLAGTQLGQKIIAAAKTQLGVDYAWGAGSPEGPSRGNGESGKNNSTGIGFDCSGFTNYAYYQAGVPTPDHVGHGLATNGQWALAGGYNQRTPGENGDWVRGIDGTQMQVGDMIFWANLGHVGLYMGDGKAIHAGDPINIVELEKNGDKPGQKFYGWLRNKKVAASAQGGPMGSGGPEDGWIKKKDDFALPVTKKPIPYGKARKKQMLEYIKRHTGPKQAAAELSTPELVVHGITGTSAFGPAWREYASNRPVDAERPGECAHFIITEKGAIMQIAPLTLRCRYANGLTHAAISIAHVGESDAEVMANKAQKRSSMRLSRWLQAAYGINTDEIIGRGENLDSPAQRELSIKLQDKTHPDFTKKVMSIYRRELRSYPIPTLGAKDKGEDEPDEAASVTPSDDAAGGDDGASSASIRPLTAAEKKILTDKGVWRSGCPVSLNDIRRIKVQHVTFGGANKTGYIDMHKDVAKSVADVFDAMHEEKFPIAKVEPIEKYYPASKDGQKADWNSIEANNTSGFNCRKATGGSAFSNHSYGRAFDINPIQNPWVEPNGTVYHEASKPYVNRKSRPGMAIEGGFLVKLMTRAGWAWGGTLFLPTKDYQHFEIKGAPKSIGPSDDDAEDAPAPPVTRAKTVSVQGDALMSIPKRFFKPGGWTVASYDAGVGREATEALARLKEQKLGRIVVYAIGTTGYGKWTSQQWERHIVRVIQTAGQERCVVIPTLWVDGQEKAGFTRILRETQGRFGGTRLRVAEWAKAVAAAGGPEMLSDGTRPRDEAGWKARIKTITDAMAQCD